MKQGAIILAHGSKRKAANEEIYSMVREIQERDEEMLYEAAFMSFGEPDIPAAIARLASRGVQSIIIMPFFLGTGNHISQDIPELLRQEKRKYPELDLKMAVHLAGHPGLIDIVLDRIRDVSSLKRVE